MKMDKKELAIAYHDKKFNCCQAVACAFAREVGVSEEVLFKAGEGFGLGMGGMWCPVRCYHAGWHEEQ